MPPIVRSILAIVAGLVVIGALSFASGAALAAAGVIPAQGQPVHGIHALLVITLSVAVFAIFGCWLTAYLAPSHPMRHALILGVLGLAFNVISLLAVWDLYPAWFSIASLALVMPYAWLGGRLRERQLEGAPGMATS